MNKRYTESVANLTLSIEDNLLKSARILALQNHTSVNQLVRDFLADLVADSSRKDEAMRWLLAARFDYDPTPLSRDSIYER